MLGLMISSIFSSSLTLECFKLGFWIIQLCVSINNFVVVDEELESLRKSLFGSMPFSQWRHDGRSLCDEAWVFALTFQVLTNQFVYKSGCCSWSFAIKTLSGTKVIEKFSRLISVELVICWEIIILENF